MTNFVSTISHEPFDKIPGNLPDYIIETSLRTDKFLVTLASFSRSQKD